MQEFIKKTLIKKSAFCCLKYADNDFHFKSSRLNPNLCASLASAHVTKLAATLVLPDRASICSFTHIAILFCFVSPAESS